MPRKKSNLSQPKPQLALVPPKPPRLSSKLLKGFKDILPDEQRYWQHVQKVVEKISQQFLFSAIETPVLEETSLFVRSVGKDTDIVSKEMFSFIDQAGDNVCLRPEITASVVRAYIEHGLQQVPQPVKLWYLGPVFRRENPQAGRLRGFHQFGFEVIGSALPIIDAQLITIAYTLCLDLGIKAGSFNIQVNSIGCPQCRPEYKKELVSYYKAKKKYLCENCKKRLVKNPMRLLDCKVPGCVALKADAPQVLDWIDDDCKSHFMGVLEFLDALEIAYILSPHLVRGLDYYSRTVFEIWPQGKETVAQSALGSGGRYDHLAETLGGNPTGAAGMAFGTERLITFLKEQDVKLREKKQPEIFLAQIGQQAKIKALKLFEKFRKEGIFVYENFSKDSLKSQLETADKLKVKYTLIIGQKEVLDGTVLVRDMEAGVQEVFNYEKVAGEMRKKLSVK